MATIGQHHATTYVATKGAVLSFTKALAVDEAHYGVRVNAVSPGNIFTPLWQQAIDASPDPGRTRADGEAAQPMGRMGTPHEVARLCVFLAAEATFTTGADHFVTGARNWATAARSARESAPGSGGAITMPFEKAAEAPPQELPPAVHAGLQRLLVQVESVLTSSIDRPSRSRSTTGVR